MSPQVSVVVPVWNAEAYLARCVDSILGQTLTDIEVVLVDDGSTDASGAMIDDYAARDPRVKAIHTDNRGPGMAIHTGIHATRGQYVTVYDNDDYAPLDALEHFYAKAEATGADLVAGDFWQNRSFGSPDFSLVHHRLELDGNEPFQALKRLLGGEWKGALWTLLVRRELYVENIREIPLSYYAQDLTALVQLFCLTRKMVRIDHPVYYHEQREGSLSHRWSNWSPKRRDEYRIITQWVLDYLEKIPGQTLFIDELAYFALVRTSIWQLKNYETGQTNGLSEFEARIYSDYYINPAARRRMRKVWPKQFIFLSAKRHAGWRLVKNALWGTPLMRGLLRAVRKSFRN